MLPHGADRTGRLFPLDDHYEAGGNIPGEKARQPVEGHPNRCPLGEVHGPAMLEFPLPQMFFARGLSRTLGGQCPGAGSREMRAPPMPGFAIARPPDPDTLPPALVIETPLPGTADPAEMNLARPDREIWREESASRQVPGRRFNQLRHRLCSAKAVGDRLPKGPKGNVPRILNV